MNRGPCPQHSAYTTVTCPYPHVPSSLLLEQPSAYSEPASLPFTVTEPHAPTLVVTIKGGQGSGKSRMAEVVRAAARLAGIRVAIVEIQGGT